MRTTIRIDDSLLADAKALAARTHRSLNSVIEDAIRAALARSSDDSPGPPVRLPTVSGHGLQPGVNLDDGAALRELMDEWDAAH